MPENTRHSETYPPPATSSIIFQSGNVSPNVLTCSCCCIVRGPRLMLSFSCPLQSLHLRHVQGRGRSLAFNQEAGISFSRRLAKNHRVPVKRGAGGKTPRASEPTKLPWTGLSQRLLRSMSEPRRRAIREESLRRARSRIPLPSRSGTEQWCLLCLRRNRISERSNAIKPHS